MFSKQAYDAHAHQVHDVKQHAPGYLAASQKIRTQQPQNVGPVVVEKETTTKFKTTNNTNKAATTLGILGTVVGLTILAYGASVLLKNKNKNPTASMMQRIKQNIGSTTSDSGLSTSSGSSSSSSSSSSEYNQPIAQKVKSRLRKLGLTASSDAQPQFAPGMSKKKFAATAAVPVAAAKLKNKIGKKGFRSATSDSSDYSSEEIEQPAVVSSRIKGFWKRPVIVEEEEEVIEEVPTSVTTSTVSDVSTSSEDKKIKRKRGQRLRKLFNKKH